MTTRKAALNLVCDTVSAADCKGSFLDCLDELAKMGFRVHNVDPWWDTNVPVRRDVFWNGQKIARAIFEDSWGVPYSHVWEVTPAEWAEERAARRERNRKDQASYMLAVKEVSNRLTSGKAVSFRPGENGGTLWAPIAQRNVSAPRTLARVVGEARAQEMLDAATQEAYDAAEYDHATIMLTEKAPRERNDW
jgi:hypothetical protein